MENSNGDPADSLAKGHAAQLIAVQPGAGISQKQSMDYGKTGVRLYD